MWVFSYNSTDLNKSTEYVRLSEYCYIYEFMY